MSLSAKAVDRIFDRMAATYGLSWDRSLGSAPVADVKTIWAHELSGFADKDRLPHIAWALENLPETPPNAIKFRNLCRLAPELEVPKLPAPKADPERVKAEVAKLIDAAGIKRGPQAEKADHKAWARRILAEKTAGINVSAIRLRFANEALREHIAEPA